MIILSCPIFQKTVAQQTITIGTQHTLFSKILNEERAYWIYVPETEPGKQYPVLYLLDGDVFFHSVVGFTRLFASSKVSTLTPCIVVAVLNTDRERDMTPTASTALRDGTLASNAQPKGGGAELFYRFLMEELRPEIEKGKPFNGQNMLVGHSYAALFTMHVLLSHPEAFQTYIAIDPSLWWDQGYIMGKAETIAQQTDYTGRQLYVAFGTKPRPDKVLINNTIMNTFLEIIIPQMQHRNLRVMWRKFETETHGTIAIPGFYDALKSLFLKKNGDI